MKHLLPFALAAALLAGCDGPTIEAPAYQAQASRQQTGIATDLGGGATLRLYDSQRCTIHEVLTVVPQALGGREVSSGGYVNVCYWRDAGHVFVVSEMGSKDVLPESRFYAIAN